MTYTLGNSFETFNDPQGNMLIAFDRNGYVILQAVEFSDGTVQTTASSGSAPTLITVPFSATPTFNAALGSNFQITLTGNVTSSTLSGATAGQILTFKIIEDATGSRTFVWPTNVKNAMSITGQAEGANEINTQSFLYDGTNAYATTPGLTYP